MISRRMLPYAVLISIPALAIVSFLSYFIICEVPRAVRAEPGRLGRAYREVAEDLAEHPANGQVQTARQKGWRQAGKIDGRAWGYSTDGEKTLVWLRTEDREWRVTTVDTIRPFPYVWVFYCGGPVLALVLIGLTLYAIACQVRFLRERDDFLAAAAHDLTTPLVGLRMLIGRDDEEAKHLTERMVLLVGNIKDFLKCGGRRKKPARTDLDLASLVREAYRLFAEDYAEEESGPVVFQNESLRLSVCGDETLVLQILWNLFGNDLKYAAPYGSVVVRFVSEGSFAGVDFIDEGQGMSPRQMRRAFDRYYRARTALTSGKGGFGIGLCTSRDSARAMGGDLSVRRNQPKGCIFSLRLPRVGS